jgi:DNA-binding NarL/FixJ family response regulator
MGISVLIADDHAIIRDGLSALIERHPELHVVGCAATGREAVDQAAELKPQIVVMDIAMPELNGIEATSQILANSPDVQVIILSMHAAKDLVYRALRAGARGYLLKDSAGEEVVAAIRAVHTGHRYLSPAISDKVVEDYLQQPREIDPLEALSTREREVLQLTVEGNNTTAIAEKLHLSPRTVETYRSRFMQKLDLNDLTALIKFAIQHGLTSLE